jgi:nucleotide-binding universal stress UspA family protein
VVGADGSDPGDEALAVALQLAAVLGSSLHVVSAYGPPHGPSDAEAVLAEARRAARAKGMEAVTHPRRDDPAHALIAIAQEHDADLLIVGSRGIRRAPRSLLGSVSEKVSHDAPAAF